MIHKSLTTSSLKLDAVDLSGVLTSLKSFVWKCVSTCEPEAAQYHTVRAASGAYGKEVKTS